MKTSSKNSNPKSLVSEELLDVVDEHNQIIAQATRGEIHAQGLRHRAVHILIYNKKAEMFLQKRSMIKDDFPGYWDSSAAGHVDAGESYDQCLHREVKEELGIDLKEQPKKLFMLEATPETGMEFCQVYKAILEGPFVLDKDEIDEGRWFSEEEINNCLIADDQGLTPSIKIMIQKMKESG